MRIVGAVALALAGAWFLLMSAGAFANLFAGYQDSQAWVYVFVGVASLVPAVVCIGLAVVIVRKLRREGGGRV